MLCFPSCKINLGLRVVRKRADGFHDLDTIFYPVHSVYDVLEIQTAEEYSLRIHGDAVAGAPGSNLVTRAYELLRQHDDRMQPCQVHLLKTIPSGAGLGGGSADAAFMLKLLNEYYRLNLSADTLIDLALQLGSDCPFFINNKACRAQGRGELFSDTALNLGGTYIVMLKPDLHVSTAQAFAGIVPNADYVDLDAAHALPRTEWKQVLVNDFERTIFKIHPQLAALKQTLYDAGAFYASMSGTGSVVFGLFDQAPALEVQGVWQHRGVL